MRHGLFLVITSPHSTNALIMNYFANLKDYGYMCKPSIKLHGEHVHDPTITLSTDKIPKLNATQPTYKHNLII